MADLADFPDFARQQIELGAVIPRNSEYIKCCTGPIKYRDTRAVQQDLRILKEAAEKSRPVDGVFLTAASPGVVALFQTNRHYESHEEYVGALVPELAKEYNKG